MVVVEVLRSSSDVVSSMGDMFFISLFDPMSCTYRRLGVLTVLPILALSFFPFIPPLLSFFTYMVSPCTRLGS
jgi:hypothetical protein